MESSSLTMADLKSVGRSERRVDSVKLATGRGTFVDDIALPGMLYARILRSPHAHAQGLVYRFQSAGTSFPPSTGAHTGPSQRPRPS